MRDRGMARLELLLDRVEDVILYDPGYLYGYSFFLRSGLLLAAVAPVEVVRSDIGRAGQDAADALDAEGLPLRWVKPLAFR